MVKGWYCKDNLDANNSKGLRNWRERGVLTKRCLFAILAMGWRQFWGEKLHPWNFFFLFSITGEKLDYQCWLPSWWAQWHFPKQYSTSSSLVSCVVDNTLWTTMIGSLQCFYTLFQMVSGYLFPFSVWWP